MDTKIHFDCDYLEGAHPAILQRLLETNMDQVPGYGEDKYTTAAKEKIKAACECPEAEVTFLVGGTQANATVIKAVLHVTEGVVAAETGHVSVHEAGAIEATGHKVLVLPAVEGKVSGESVEAYMKSFFADPTHPHMVQPGMVYISHPTEYGTLYTLPELQSLSTVCHKYHLPLYVDGARLGYGLAAPSDVTLPILASLADIFLIGGTKVGAFCGEAVVFTRPNLVRNFFTTVKQSGALLAKGRLLGIQFDTLFTDKLYFSIGRHAIDLAMQIKHALKEKGYEFYLDSPTNQQFVILTPSQKEKLDKYIYYDVFATDKQGREIIRIATSWATTQQNVDTLISIL